MGNFWSGAGGERDWAGLPEELVGAIAERLPIPDHARFRAVCTSWASAAASPSVPHFPWLTLDRNGPRHSFLDIAGGRSYRLSSSSRSSTCVGSRNGRLVILDSSNASLVNPVNRARIDLPSFRTLPWSKAFFDVRKVAVSDDENRPVALALVYSLSCCHLAFARAGDEAWTPLDFLSPPSQRIEDAVCHDGKFFIVFTRGKIQWFDLSRPIPEASRLHGRCAADAATAHSSYGVHLVPSSGNLLRVEREREVPTGTTTKFSITKFDPESDSGWVDVKDLGDKSLFLDAKVSMSLSARDVPSVRRNCIYFAEDVPHSGKVKVGDLKTFDVAKGVVEPFRVPNYRGGDIRLVSPIWFTPSPF